MCLSLRCEPPGGAYAIRMPRPGDTPLPWCKVVAICIINISEPIAVTSLFPLAPFMVADWVGQDATGVWAGLLASVYNLSSLVANVAWGHASDRVGRLPCLTVQLIGTAACLLLFGMSTSLVHAIAARAFGGLFGGLTTVTRACMREVTDKTNRGRAFALFGWSWAVGMLVGPMVGGLLSNPAESVDGLRNTLLDTFPYLLPMMASSVVCFVGLGCLHILRGPPQRAQSEDTTTSTTKPSAAPMAPAAALTAAPAPEALAPEASAPDGARQCETGVMHEVELNEINESGPVGASTQANRAARERDDLHLLAGASKGGSSAEAHAAAARLAWARWLTSPLMLLVYAHGLLNLQVTGMSELFPLFCTRAAVREVANATVPLAAATSAPTAFEGDNGGLGLSAAEVGRAIAPLGLTLFLTPLAYPQ